MTTHEIDMLREFAEVGVMNPERRAALIKLIGEYYELEEKQAATRAELDRMRTAVSEVREMLDGARHDVALLVLNADAQLKKLKELAS